MQRELFCYYYFVRFSSFTMENLLTHLCFIFKFLIHFPFFLMSCIFWGLFLKTLYILLSSYLHQPHIDFWVPQLKKQQFISPIIIKHATPNNPFNKQKIRFFFFYLFFFPDLFCVNCEKLLANVYSSLPKVVIISTVLKL